MIDKKLISSEDLIYIKLLLRPLVFIPMAVDLLHHGHIRILNKASKYGTLVVGLMTDTGLTKYKGKPILNYKQRKEIISEIKAVDYVIPLNGLKYLEICNAIKPNYFVHGSDWKKGPQSTARYELIKNQNKWGGRVKEFESTKNITSTIIKRKIFKRLIK